MDPDAPEPEGPQPAEDVVVTRPPRTSTSTRGRRTLAAVAAVAVVAVVVAFALVWSRTTDSPEPRRDSGNRPTTTVPAPWPATEARIATAKGSKVEVHADPPPGWATMTPTATWDNPAPPNSQPTMPPRAALPRSDFPIQGRYTSATGWTFNSPSAWGDPFVMLVTEQRGDWLKVEIPVRPNGTPGYVRSADVTMSSTDYHLDLRLGTRTLTLYQGSTVVLSTPVVIGKPETHTPTGRFYITDKVDQSSPQGAYGPIVMPTNAYSEQIDLFDNGVPVIALHGTNRPELVGQPVSNGCVRIPNEQILKIASLIPNGTPIDIAA